MVPFPDSADRLSPSYLPPVAAPEPIRNLMANVLFSQNPVALRTAAKNVRELGYAEAAAILDARAAQLEPPKAVAGAWFGDWCSERERQLVQPIGSSATRS